MEQIETPKVQLGTIETLKDFVDRIKPDLVTYLTIDNKISPENQENIDKYNELKKDIATQMVYNLEFEDLQKFREVIKTKWAEIWFSEKMKTIELVSMTYNIFKDKMMADSQALSQAFMIV